MRGHHGLTVFLLLSQQVELGVEPFLTSYLSSVVLVLLVPASLHDAVEIDVSVNEGRGFLGDSVRLTSVTFEADGVSILGRGLETLWKGTELIEEEMTGFHSNQPRLTPEPPPTTKV